MCCFTKRCHIKAHQERWSSCLGKASGDRMFILYYEDKFVEYSVKHFKTAKMQKGMNVAVKASFFKSYLGFDTK